MQTINVAVTANNSRVLQTAIRQYLKCSEGFNNWLRWATIENLRTRAYLDPRFFLLCGLEIFSITSNYFETLKLITLFFTKQVPSFYVLLKYLNCFSKIYTKFIYHLFIIQGEHFHSFFINLVCISQLFWLILPHNAEPLEAQARDDFRLSQLLSRSRWQSYD